MNDLDQRIRQLMQEIGDNAPAPPGWDPSATPSDPARRPSRPVWLAAAAIVTVTAGVAALALVATRDTATAPTVDTSVGTLPPPTTTVSEPTTTVVPTTTNPRSPTTTTIGPLEPASTLTPIAVGTPLPAPLELVPFASIDLPAGDGGPLGLPAVAALSAGRAVVVDGDRSEFVIVDAAGSQRRVPISTEYPPFMLTGGPGDVVYGITPSPTETDAGAAHVVAFSVAADSAGTIVGSAPTGMNQFMEAAPTILAHGPDGIVNRRVGDTLFRYVGDSGGPVALDVPAPLYEIDDAGLVTDLTGTAHWQLDIERQPGYAGAYVTDAPPSSLSNGRAVYATAIGPPVNPNSDATTPTLPVVALLRGRRDGNLVLTHRWLDPRGRRSRRPRLRPTLWRHRRTRQPVDLTPTARRA